MVRPTGGRSSSRRAAPSAQEMLNSISRDIFGDEFQGGPVSSSKAAFNSITDIMYDDSQSMDFYKPTNYANWAGEIYRTAEGDAPSRSNYEIIDFNGNLNAQQMDNPNNWKIPGFQPDELEDDSPADLTLVPTSTTDPSRPRTVAAGYDEEEGKLTVVFRDGTFYNYYEVDKNEWRAFKANRSKGAIIAQMLDYKPRGPANVTSLSKKAQEAFYRYSRGAQLHSQGKGKSTTTPSGQNSIKYKTYSQKSAGKNPSQGGKSPKRK